MTAVFIAPVQAISREIFGVCEDNLVIVIGVSNGIYLHVLVRDGGICQNDIAEEVSGANRSMDGVILPGLIVPSYHEPSTVKYLVSATGFPIPVSVLDVL